MGASSRDSSEHYECVSRVQDPEIQEMDRQRRLSWSVTVGAVDSRSIDTGLNELHRITGEMSYLLNCGVGWEGGEGYNYFSVCRWYISYI